MPITLIINDNNELEKSYYMKNKDKIKCFSKNKIKKNISYQLLIMKKREQVKREGITIDFN